jgi:septal ring factor EnvC (AmiA/AmiB activator)
MVREKHSVYVDTDKYQNAKKNGINISEVLERALSKISQDEEFENTLILDYLESQIKEREQKLDAIDEDRKIIEKQLNTVKAEYRRIAKQYKMEEDAIAMSKLLAALNRIINECEFDRTNIKEAAREILTQIYKLNKHFSLEKHVDIVEDTYCAND